MVAYVNIGSYYLIGIPLGILLGWLFNLGVLVRCVLSASLSLVAHLFALDHDHCASSNIASPPEILCAKLLQGIWAGMIGGTAVQTLILAIMTVRCDWEKEVSHSHTHTLIILAKNCT